MTIETPPQLFELIKDGNITHHGVLAHELALSDHLLRSVNPTEPPRGEYGYFIHESGRVNFAMSPEMIDDHTKRRTHHIETLGIPEDEVNTRIAEFRAELEASETFAPHKMIGSILMAPGETIVLNEIQSQ